MLELTILSIIQGITEFIPVSSSAHLILASEFLHINEDNLTLDVSLHIGSLFAIIYYFLKDINVVLKKKEIFIKIFISSIPVTIFGFILIQLEIIQYVRNYKVIGWTTIIFGILLFYSDKFKNKKVFNKDFTIKSAIIIGLFEVLSLIPGTSRSGIALTAARFLKFDRIEAAKISFFTAIPVLFYASAYNFFKLFNQNNFNISLINFLGIILSFIFSYITIRFFLKFLKNFNLTTFVIYRLCLGIVILFYVYK